MSLPTPREQLARQLRFIQASVDAFDRGSLDEAIRIATATRVIVHQTRHSESLLSQLDSREVSLLTTTRGPLLKPAGENPWDRTTAYRLDGAGRISIRNGKTYYGPKLGGGSFASELSAPDWWNQVVFVLDPATVFTRCKIVLGAANQDGGAHVDPAMDANYTRMAYVQEYGALVEQSETGEVRIPLYGYHLIALRQIGYELLNSSSLQALAT